MDFLPYSQGYMFIVSVMSGMILGCIWDIYRLIRHYIKFGVIGTALGDIVYWIISVYISVQIIFDISYGNIRFFILIGFMLGAFLYFYGISNYILKVLIFIVDWILKVIKKLIIFIIYPIKFVWDKIEKAILYPIKLKIVKWNVNIKRRYKFFKFRLKKISKNKKMYYNKKKQMKRKKHNLSDKRRKELKQNDRRSKDNRIEKKNKS